MFSWDARKASQNLEKHGISFEEAATVFADFEGLDWEDAGHSGAERRLKRLGRAATGRVLLIVYTIRRLAHGKETIRIIHFSPRARQSSRKERKERKAYSRQPD
ncbi:MAG: BrnT family toxin [Candidatus Acidiferrales bacterium]